MPVIPPLLQAVPDIPTGWERRPLLLTRERPISGSAEAGAYHPSIGLSSNSYIILLLFHGIEPYIYLKILFLPRNFKGDYNNSDCCVYVLGTSLSRTHLLSLVVRTGIAALWFLNRKPKLVDRLGLEPRSEGLKVPCISLLLRAVQSHNLWPNLNAKSRIFFHF